MSVEFIVFMPKLTSVTAHEQILRLTRHLRTTPSNRHPDVAQLRPTEASHLAWTTEDELAVARLRRVGAIIIARTRPPAPHPAAHTSPS